MVYSILVACFYLRPTEHCHQFYVSKAIPADYCRAQVTRLRANNPRKLIRYVCKDVMTVIKWRPNKNEI